MCRWVLSQIRSAIDEKVKEGIQTQGGIDDASIVQIVAQIVTESFDTWNGYTRLTCFTDGFETELTAAYKPILDQLIDEIFGKLPIEPVRDQLLQICAFRVTKDWWSLSSGGVVVAGFGMDEIVVLPTNLDSQGLVF
jgi:hypothetical protein